MNPGQPHNDEYADYFHQYIQSALDEPDILMCLESQIGELRQLVQQTPADELTKPHPPYTWTITQAIGHLVDQERIFGYRAARFASSDPVELPGYDQEVITNNAGYERCNATSVLDEFEHLRRGNLLLFKRLNEQQWNLQGVAESKLISVRAIAYLLVGHVRYHARIFAKRLGNDC